MWATQDISFDLDDEMTDRPVVTVLVTTPAGSMTVLAEIDRRGQTWLLKGTHVQGRGSNSIGAANLMVMAHALMEGLGLHGLDIEGALRTTGANPDHRPRLFRFSRRVRSPPHAGPAVP